MDSSPELLVPPLNESGSCFDAFEEYFAGSKQQQPVVIQEGAYVTRAGKKCIVTNKGKIKSRKGPMGSGKSEWLIEQLKHWKAAGRRVLGFSPVINTREKLIRSRNGETHSCIRTETLMQYVDMVLDDGVQVIGIDEAHFFSDLYEFCTLMAGFGVMVLLVYLNGTFRHTPWNNVVPLMAEMEEDIMIQGPCYRCPYGIDTLASFTIRTRILDEEEDTSGNDSSSSSSETTTPVPAVSGGSNNKKANDQKPVIGDIGDDALYIPVCRQCRLDRDPYNAV